MTIKEECEYLYEIIKIAQHRLDEIREHCNHSEVFLGTYQHRIGSFETGFICGHCNTFIKAIQ